MSILFLLSLFVAIYSFGLEHQNRDKANEFSKMYNVSKKIMRTCNFKSDNDVLRKMISDDILKVCAGGVHFAQTSWYYTFRDLINNPYNARLDGDYLRVFKNIMPTTTPPSKFLFCVFTHWMISKLNYAPKSLLDSQDSAEIVAIIMKNIKWNQDYFIDILEPLWKNFVAPTLFNKLHTAASKVDDGEYLKSQCYLNTIIGSYLMTFCGYQHAHFFGLIDKETACFRFISVQTAFYNIMSTEGLFDIETRSRYFELWLHDPRIMSIKQALDAINTPWGDDPCQNADIVKYFIGGLIVANETMMAEHYLHCAFQKDRILLMQATLRRDKQPIDGYYVTADMIKSIRQKAAKYLCCAGLQSLQTFIGKLSSMFGRDLMPNRNISTARPRTARSMGLCRIRIPCSTVRIVKIVQDDDE